MKWLELVEGKGYVDFNFLFCLPCLHYRAHFKVGDDLWQCNLCGMQREGEDDDERKRLEALRNLP